MPNKSSAAHQTSGRTHRESIRRRWMEHRVALRPGRPRRGGDMPSGGRADNVPALIGERVIGAHRFLLWPADPYLHCHAATRPVKIEGTRSGHTCRVVAASAHNFLPIRRFLHVGLTQRTKCGVAGSTSKGCRVLADSPGHDPSDLRAGAAIFTKPVPGPSVPVRVLYVIAPMIWSCTSSENRAQGSGPKGASAAGRPWRIA
jgi:hypothetical protein